MLTQHQYTAVIKWSESSGNLWEYCVLWWKWQFRLSIGTDSGKRLLLHICTLSAWSWYFRLFSLPVIFSKENIYIYIKKTLSCLLFYPDECFSESERPPAATLKHGEILRRSQTSSHVLLQTWGSVWHNTEVHVCTQNAWLTTITVHYTVNALSAGKLVFHFKCPSSLLFSSLCLAQDNCS